jgi:hypothetical protein
MAFMHQEESDNYMIPFQICIDQKIIYLTSILHLSIPDMCSMNVEKYTLFIYISGIYWVFLHIVHISYTYYI